MPNTRGRDFCKYFYTTFNIAKADVVGRIFSQWVIKLRLMGSPWTSIFYHTTSLSLFQTDSQKIAGASSLECLTLVLLQSAAYFFAELSRESVNSPDNKAYCDGITNGNPHKYQCFLFMKNSTNYNGIGQNSTIRQHLGPTINLSSDRLISRPPCT